MADEKIEDVWGESTIDDIVRQYLGTALWSSTITETDEDGEEQDTPADELFSVDDCDEESLKQAYADVRTFLQDALKIGLTPDVMDEFGMEYDRIGHDLWLTRNGHGAGFWDGDYESDDLDLGDKLSELAHAYGESYIFPNEDGRFTIE